MCLPKVVRLGAKSSNVLNSMVTSSVASSGSEVVKDAAKPVSKSSHERLEHVYRDRSHEEVPFVGGGDLAKSKSRGVSIPFPLKLHQILDKIEAAGLEWVVGWQPHGRCFAVHKQKEFLRHVMPTYFEQNKMSSFQRQLNLYGFRRITQGIDKGGYYHELFLRGKPYLCQKISRTRVKGTRVRKPSNPESEPNFYEMPPVCDLRPKDARVYPRASPALDPNMPTTLPSIQTNKRPRANPVTPPTSRQKIQDFPVALDKVTSSTLICKVSPSPTLMSRSAIPNCSKDCDNKNLEDLNHVLRQAEDLFLHAMASTFQGIDRPLEASADEMDSLFDSC